jgi:FAD/FMN-containing dehydrogenase
MIAENAGGPACLKYGVTKHHVFAMEVVLPTGEVAQLLHIMMSKVMDEIFQSAVTLGGVISGEHGIGLEKQKFFTKTVDPAVLTMMKKVKTLLDPNNIMNPGKIWSDAVTGP